MRLPWLAADRPDLFPPTSMALVEPNGLLCAGGDLRPERLLTAYSRGIFPWFSQGEPILWWSPQPRCVLPLDAVSVPKRLLRTWRRSGWSLSADTDFAGVIDACAAPRARQPQTWITPQMRRAYIALHQMGHAHSVEVRDGGGALIGGIYGIALGRVFFGESMFSRATDASKTALFALARVLHERGFVLLDGQVESAHLMTLGFALWQRGRFESVLEPLPGAATRAGSWRAQWPLGDAHLLSKPPGLEPPDGVAPASG